MKVLSLILSVLIFSAFSPQGFAKTKIQKPPHIEMDLRGYEYKKILDEKNLRFQNAQDPDSQKLQPVLDLGERNMKFLQFLNSHRDAAHQISITSEATERGIPVESPRIYNLAICYQNYVDLLTKLPEPLAKVLIGTADFPTELPLPEAEYIKWGLEVDSVYQMAARWLTLKEWLPYYKEAKKDDIRGFYYLNQETDLRAKLANWKNLDSKVQEQYREWLLGSCNNSFEQVDCVIELNQILNRGESVLSYWDKYGPLSKKHYDQYFLMAWPRTDVIFRKDQPDVLHIPFVDPQDARVLSYLRDNIEDEWKWNGWQLRLDFQPGNPETMSHIEWQSGVTPHVSLPSTIVMDKNQPTTEYDSQWTIRHEFGHIMGLPDCYIEFYDVNIEAMISYQLDITNLMCSRRGHFKEIHLDELKKTYLK